MKKAESMNKKKPEYQIILQDLVTLAPLFIFAELAIPVLEREMEFNLFKIEVAIKNLEYHDEFLHAVGIK